MILAGDIGGTHTRLAYYASRSGRPHQICEKSYSSTAFSGLEEIVERFLAEFPEHSLTAASFGIAGPVKNGRCTATNLPWVVDARDLASFLKLERVGLLNDLEANAYGLALLGEEDFAVLNPGRSTDGNQAVISAGTGLGEAGLIWDGEQHRPFASEGGHTSFAPTSSIEIELLRYLQKRFDHASWERVLSGPGLVNIYEFLRDEGQAGPARPLSRDGDLAGHISKAALDGTCPVSMKALEIFVELYGAEAGNLALKMLAVGGLYIGGGIAPKILAKLQGPEFMARFVEKGRFRELLRAIPVRVILNEQTALLGAARHAFDQK